MWLDFLGRRKMMEGFRAHGTIAPTLTADMEDARRVLAEAERLRLDLASVAAALVTDGIRHFREASDAMLGAIPQQRVAPVEAEPAR